jgi:glycosyltransferase involved in cell wall biosynthesis
MPVYNAGDYLMPAIESILKQTYTNFEFIIVNDASTDKSGDIIAAYEKKFPEKIRVITMRRNLNRGGDTCANEALQIAKGKYVARMDADDIAHPERLEKQVAFLQTNPHIWLVGTNAQVINENGTVIGDKLEPTSSQDIYRSYFTFHPIIHPSAMYRRMLDGKPFLYSIKFSANNDYYSFFKALCKGAHFANLEEQLLYYRIHGKNDTFVHIKEKYLNTLKVRAEMFFKYKYDPTPKQFFTTIVQTLVLLLLPEKITKQLYLISKGIVKIDSPIKTVQKIFKHTNSYKLRFGLKRFSAQKLG